MKILAFVDTHGNLNLLDKAISKSKDIDLIICCGDLSNFGRNFKEGINKLKKLKKLVLIIHGNHETSELIDSVCDDKNIINLHKKSYELNDYLFFGFGGGGFHTLNKDFENVTKKFKSTIKKNSKIILITHGPPYGTKLDFIDDCGYVGCKSMRKFIEENNVLLNICGHIHENLGKIDHIKKTLIVNPGPSGRIIKV